MYTYNKNDKSYTFSADELDIDKIIDTASDKNITNAENSSNSNSNLDDSNDYNEANKSNDSNQDNDTNQDYSNSNNNSDENNNLEDSSDASDFSEHKRPRKIEVINGGNDLDISPVTNYIEVEKPRNEKKENIVIPKNNKWHFGACH